MFPTLLDLKVQIEINNERIMKAALRRQYKSHTRNTQNTFASRIVRFGAWLERVGCRLQNRFSSPSNLELSSTTMSDAHLQRC